MTFEWLGAYIATISEKTRQAPEVIGTSLNSIMARLHSIKQKGFNEEDTTKINDIAKALATLEKPIKLIDEATGEWRDMPMIFKEIAEQWDTLDAKQRAYISTTMAGTRQQNYFLALMSDMAKGAEGGSRAFELYEGAMTAAGTASQKYGVWQESVEAAQNRLTAAMQDFYSLLDADWMKGFYDGMAGLVRVITAGTDALGGWNLMIPAIAIGVTGLIAVIYKAVIAIKAMRVALAAGQGIASIMSGGTIGLIIAAVGALATVVTMIAGVAASANEVEKIDYSGTIEAVGSYRDNIDDLVTELETLASKTDLTAEEQARADEIMKTLSGTSLSMKEALEGGGEGFDTLGEKAAAARGEVERTDQALRSLKASDALQNLRDADRAYMDAVSEAQSSITQTGRYDRISDAYSSYMSEHPQGTYKEYYQGAMGMGATKDENFYVYATHQARKGAGIFASSEEKQRAQESMAFWSAIVDEMKQLGIDASSSTEEISNKMLEFDIAAASYMSASGERLQEAWQPVMDDLYTVMTDGTQFSQLPQFMQTAATAYYDSYIAGIDQQKALAEGDLMAMAADLSGYVNTLFSALESDPAFMELADRYDELFNAPRTSENVDALNALVPQINEYIKTYNALTETKDDDIPLLTDIVPTNEAEQAAQNLQLLSDSLETYFAKAKKAKEAEAAKENLYGDQLMDLRAAWETNDGGAAFVNTLNDMYAANDTLAEGMLETHEALIDMADGTLTYEQGLAALTEMERLATIQAQEHTQELLDEADAAKALAAAQKDNYQGVLAQLQSAYGAGYDSFMTEWDSLSEDMKSDIIELYPEVAALATATGEAADGAAVFADALAKAATLDFSNFKEVLTTDYGKTTQKEAATQAAENGYQDQLGTLQTALATGGVEAMRQALFNLRTENEELYTGLMSTYVMLYQLGDMSLTSAQAADMLSVAFLRTTEKSAQAAEEMRKQLALEEEIAAAAKNYHADTLKKLQAGYTEGGSKGFHEVWDTLDDDTQEYILKTYDAVGDLACETIERSVDIVDAIFEEALTKAGEMREELLRQSLAEDAQEYMTQKPVEAAKDNSYQDQLTVLRDSLADGTFMETLTSFGDEMANALIAENEWINEVIYGLESAEEGTYSLDEATGILNEHIFGTKEYLLAMAEAMTESNAELLSTEEEQIAMLSAMLALLEEGGVDAFAAAFGELDAEMQKALIDSSPAIKKFFKNLSNGSEDSAEAVGDLKDEIKGLNLKKLQRDGKVWDSLTDAMEDAAKGGKDFSKSYGAVIKQTEDLTEAQGALAFVQSDGVKNADDLTDAYNILASYCGVSADSLRNNLDPALWAISSDMNMATNSAAYLANWLWQTAGVTFSAGNWQAQLAALAASADSTTANVARLVQTMLQCAGANLSLGADGTININLTVMRSFS